MDSRGTARDSLPHGGPFPLGGAGPFPILRHKLGKRVGLAVVNVHPEFGAKLIHEVIAEVHRFDKIGAEIGEDEPLRSAVVGLGLSQKQADPRTDLPETQLCQVPVRDHRAHHQWKPVGERRARLPARQKLLAGRHRRVGDDEALDSEPRNCFFPPPRHFVLVQRDLLPQARLAAHPTPHRLERLRHRRRCRRVTSATESAMPVVCGCQRGGGSSGRRRRRHSQRFERVQNAPFLLCHLFARLFVHFQKHAQSALVGPTQLVLQFLILRHQSTQRQLHCLSLLVSTTTSRRCPTSGNDPFLGFPATAATATAAGSKLLLHGLSVSLQLVCHQRLR
mmetsp:Transcript_51177/g.87704  ORF Transcript_51177/g.87704 Transcript_51177/m.87704 type:complete len:335 (-) Transcript_51177:211-1215(-)